MASHLRLAAAAALSAALVIVPAAGSPAAPRSPGDPCPPLSSGADCTSVDVSGDTYADAVLDRITLTGARLVGTNLNGAVLFGALLDGADATRADLADSSLIGASLQGTTLRRADLTGADLTDADISGADLTRARLVDADLEHVTAPGAAFADALLRGADLVHSHLFQADLSRADLTGADLTGADLWVASLEDAVLVNADLSGADLTGADLTGADLTGADLTMTTFRRAVWSRTTCPDGRIVTGAPCSDGGVRSESGFLTVPAFTSTIMRGALARRLASVPASLWFTYFPADRGASSAPLFVMQNGGPGAATMANLFANNTAPYTLNREAIDRYVAQAPDPGPLIPFDPDETAVDDDGDPPDDPNQYLPDTTPATPAFVPNADSWTQMGNVLYLDPALTGFSYDVSPAAADPTTPTRSFLARLDQMGDGSNLNPWVDADQVLRAVLDFLERHPALRDNPVVFVGESFGGVRVTTMLHMLLNSDRYGTATPRWPYSDPGLVTAIRGHFLGAGASGPLPQTTVLRQFGRQVLIQPQLSSYQGEVQGAMFYARDSVVDRLAAEVDGPPFDRSAAACPRGLTARSACVTLYWVPRVYQRDQYAYDRAASFTDDQEAYTLAQLNDIGTLNVLLGLDVARIPGFAPEDRAGRAYHSLWRGIESTGDQGAAVGPDAWAPGLDPSVLDRIPLSGSLDEAIAWLLRTVGIDPTALVYSRQTGPGTLTDVLGPLGPADEYVMAFNMVEWAMYSLVTPQALPRSAVSADDDPVFGDMFLENARTVDTFLTDARYDLVVYSPALPVALSRHAGVAGVTAVPGDTADGWLGQFTIRYKDGTTARIHYPYYGEAGHAVAATQPTKLREDVAAWLGLPR